MTEDSRLPPLLETVGIGCSLGIGVACVLLLDSLSESPLLLETVGLGCPVGIGVPCVLLLESLSVASTLPSLPGAVGSTCSPDAFVVVVLASVTVDSRLLPLLESVAIGCSVCIVVPCVLLLESLSVAPTLPSLPGAVGSGCPPGVFDVVVLIESFSVASESSFLLESVG